MSRPAGRVPNGIAAPIAGVAAAPGAPHARPREEKEAAQKQQLKKPPSLTSAAGPAAAAAERTEANTSTAAVTKLGVTLRGLRKLRSLWREEFPDFSDKTTGDIAKEWVRDKKTIHKKCRMLELSEVVDQADVAPPMYFISHAWQSKLSLLLSYLLDNFLLAASESTAVWLDILAVNQHRGTPENTMDVQAFDQVVKVCSGGTIVVLDASSLAICNPAKRAWCIYEWAHTLKAHGPEGFFLELNPVDRAVVVGSLDIRKAECKEEKDKEMILATVREKFGSAGRFNDKLKLQLLLEPLAYRVDIRRLTKLAAGTSWKLGDVQSWLKEGIAGRRVLCIAAGAGEGKSTISAVLCPERGSNSRVVDAYHFLKYSDQRRLEPVRIIKSLAFQLATRIPAVCQKLLELDVAEVAQLTSVEEAFTKLLMLPLQQQQQQQQGLVKPVVLLIDALDEADPVELQQVATTAAAAGSMPTCPKACGNQALQLITAHLHRLPAFVRFIFTTRPDAATGQVLHCLERTFPGGVLCLAPSALRSSNHSVGSVENAAGSRRGGVMVYHTAVAACGKRTSIPKIQGEPKLEDVYAVYGSAFEAAFTQYADKQHAQLATDLLGVLMAAKEPLPHSFVQQLRLGDGLRLLPGYPKLFFIEDHHLYLMHKSLGDWLLDPFKSRGYAARVQKGHAWLGLYLARIWQRTQQTMQLEQSAASLGRGSTSSYLLKYAVSHLAMAADSVSAATGAEKLRPELSAKAAATLDVLLQDFGFLAAVLNAGHGPAAIGALGAMKTHTGMSGDILRWLRSDLNNLVGKSASKLAEWACTAPVNAKICKLATCAFQPCWRTRRVLPVEARGWPDWLAVMQVEHKVGSLAYSPDGRQLATADQKGMFWGGEPPRPCVQLWDCTTGQSTAAFGLQYWSNVNSVAFGPDGRQLVTGSSDDGVRLWDVATGQCTSTLTGHTKSVRSVAFNPNGQQVASGSDDTSVRFWDITTGECTKGDGHSKAVTSVAYSPDGRRLASGSEDGTLRLWNAMGQQQRTKCTNTFEAGLSGITSVAFSPVDGNKVVTAFSAGALRLWDLASGQSTGYVSHGAPLDCVAFSPDGLRLATGNHCSVVQIWDVATKKCLRTLQGHSGTICGVAFSPDGNQLASGGSDKKLRLWDLSTIPLRRSGQEGGDDHHGDKPDLDDWLIRVARVTAVAFSPNGRQVASIADNEHSRRAHTNDDVSQWLCIWDIGTGQCTSKVRGIMSTKSTGEYTFASWKSFTCMAFSPDGQQLATGRGYNGKKPADDSSSTIPLVLWDSRKSDVMCGDAGGPPTRLGFNNKHNYGSLLEGHEYVVNDVAFSPDGRQLVSASADCTMRIWDSTTRQCTATLRDLYGLYIVNGQASSGVYCVAYHPGGLQQLACSGSDNRGSTVYIWDTVTWKCTKELKGFETRIKSLAYSSDGRQLAAVQCDGYKNTTTVQIWDTSVWRCKTALTLDGCASSLVFSPKDSRLLACAFLSGSDHTVEPHRFIKQDGCVQLWDTNTGQCTARLPGHSEDVTSLAFSRDGRHLISGSKDCTLRLWDTGGAGGGGTAAPTTTASKSSRRRLELAAPTRATPPTALVRPQ